MAAAERPRQQEKQPASIVAIDLGGQGPSAALYNITGQRLQFEHRPCTPIVSDQGRRVEYDTDTYINACISALKSLQDYPDCADQLQLGIAGQGSTLVCWDKNCGKALSPIISWQDTRARQDLQHLLEQPNAELEAQIEETTGLKASAHFGASKYAWCLDNLSAVRNANHDGRLAIGPLGSYLLFILSQGQQLLCDPGSAQRTMLWNRHNNEWSSELCRRFRIPPSALPQMHDNIDNFGSPMFGHLGRQPLQVRAMQRDQNCCLFADGDCQADRLYINMGTGAFAQRQATSSSAPDGLLISPALFVKHRHIFAWEGSVNGAASALPWLEKQLQQRITPQRVEVALNQDRDNWQGYFINSISGLGAPYWRTDIASEFVDADSEADKLTAWVESLVFQLSDIALLMQQSSPITRAEISGGMAVSDALCQRLADTLQVEVIRRSDSEASLRGVAYLSAPSSNDWSERPVERLFSPQANAALQYRYKRWQHAMPQHSAFQAAPQQDKQA